MLARVSFRTLVLIALVVAAVVMLVRALISGEHVGVVEYIAGVLLIAGLIIVAARLTRRVAQRG